MKMLKIIAVSAALLAGMASANASGFGQLKSPSDVQSAWGATVLTVNATEAQFLAIDTDVASLRSRVMNNRHLLDSIERQGFSVDQIVGASGDQNSLTLYAM